MERNARNRGDKQMEEGKVEKNKSGAKKRIISPIGLGASKGRRQGRGRSYC